MNLNFDTETVLRPNVLKILAIVFVCIGLFCTVVVTSISSEPTVQVQYIGAADTDRIVGETYISTPQRPSTAVGNVRSPIYEWTELSPAERNSLSKARSSNETIAIDTPATISQGNSFFVIEKQNEYYEYSGTSEVDYPYLLGVTILSFLFSFIFLTVYVSKVFGPTRSVKQDSVEFDRSDSEWKFK